MVDLEFAIGEILKYSDRAPIEFVEDPEDPAAEYVIVNTCGFLSSAREESEETLAYYDSLGKKLILMGCYVSVKDDTFLANLKNLVSIVPFMSYSVIEELVLGKKSKFNLAGIINAKQAHKQSKDKTLSNYLASIEAPGKWKKAFIWEGDEVRAYIHAPFGYEYLKIAEWCDNNCTFCIIPTIRGRQTSRPIESIIKEVEMMLSQGIQEIQIISQDTTRYGTDLYEEAKLIELLEKIDGTIDDFVIARDEAIHVSEKQSTGSPHSAVAPLAMTGTPTYRVYYLYPDILTLDHLAKLAKLKHFLPYFDIPFQHISENILKLMGRHYDQHHIFSFLDTIRTTFPTSFIRTSFIIWFPGETEENFQELCDFIEKYQFESIGIFQYHDEPLATSSKLPDKVNGEVAKNRINILTPILEKIYASKKNARKWKKQTGYVMEIPHPTPLLKERALGDKTIIIRPELHAPEVDEYDEVEIKNITLGKAEIGEKIEYIP